jgi:hypothetical protein
MVKCPGRLRQRGQADGAHRRRVAGRSEGVGQLDEGDVVGQAKEGNETVGNVKGKTKVSEKDLNAFFFVDFISISISSFSCLLPQRQVVPFSLLLLLLSASY